MSRLNFIKRFVVECASEGVINKLRKYNPSKLQEIKRYEGRADYPWDDPEESRIFWQTYRKMVEDPRR